MNIQTQIHTEINTKPVEITKLVRTRDAVPF